MNVKKRIELYEGVRIGEVSSMCKEDDDFANIIWNVEELCMCWLVLESI